MHTERKFLTLSVLRESSSSARAKTARSVRVGLFKCAETVASWKRAESCMDFKDSPKRLIDEKCRCGFKVVFNTSFFFVLFCLHQNLQFYELFLLFNKIRKKIKRQRKVNEKKTEMFCPFLCYPRGRKKTEHDTQ